MQKRSCLFLIAALLVALMTTVLNTAAMAQKVTGAIFTTDMNSTFVNGNVYDSEDGYSADDVYLNGGPRPNAPCDAAGLPSGPDGDYYYFQVTDPSGSVLLHDSSDTVAERKVKVKDGLIVAYYGTTRLTGTGKCADPASGKVNITVELFPFNLTPNPGGEYKVWMTKDVDYACYPNEQIVDCTLGGVHGFIPSKSKTDNFKVVDYDGDGIPDSEDDCPDCFDLPPPV